MYTPIEWKDEVVEHPYRYKETQNSDGTIEHTPSPGETLQEGTPQSATNFNQMDKGTFQAIEMANEAIRMLIRHGQELETDASRLNSLESTEETNTETLAKHSTELKDLTEKDTEIAGKLDDTDMDLSDTTLMAAEAIRMIMRHKEALDGLTGEIVEATLTNTQDYPFNNSTKTLQLTTPRNTKDYTVATETVSVTGGFVKEFEVSDKLLNGFKIKFNGSASSVSVRCYVRGGI